MTVIPQILTIIGRVEVPLLKAEGVAREALRPHLDRLDRVVAPFHATILYHGIRRNEERLAKLQEMHRLALRLGSHPATFHELDRDGHDLESIERRLDRVERTLDGDRAKLRALEGRMGLRRSVHG